MAADLPFVPKTPAATGMTGNVSFHPRGGLQPPGWCQCWDKNGYTNVFLCFECLIQHNNFLTVLYVGHHLVSTIFASQTNEICMYNECSFMIDIRRVIKTTPEQMNLLRRILRFMYFRQPGTRLLTNITSDKGLDKPTQLCFHMAGNYSSKRQWWLVKMPLMSW